MEEITEVMEVVCFLLFVKGHSLGMGERYHKVLQPEK